MSFFSFYTLCILWYTKRLYHIGSHMFVIGIWIGKLFLQVLNDRKIGKLEKNSIWVYDVSSQEVSARVSYNMDGFKNLRISVRLSIKILLREWQLWPVICEWVYLVYIHLEKLSFFIFKLNDLALKRKLQSERVKMLLLISINYW